MKLSWHNTQKDGLTMDNIIIIREASESRQPIIVGDTKNADMTRAEFMEACRLTGATASRSVMMDNGKDAQVWVVIS